MKVSHFIICILLFCISNFKSSCQEISENFNAILNNEEYSIDQKDKLFDQLIESHKKNQSFDLLLGDIYQIVRWHGNSTQKKRETNIEKAIVLNKMNIALMDSLAFDNVDFYRKNTYSLSYYYRKNSNLPEAIHTYKTLLIYDEPDIYAMKSAFSLGEINYELGDYYTALRLFKLAHPIAKATKQNNYVVRSAVRIAVANKLINTTKSLNDGINILNEAIRFIEDLKNDSNPKNDIDLFYVHLVYNQLGNLYSDRTDYNFDKAKANYDIALELALERNVYSSISSTYIDMGFLYLQVKDKKAEDYFKKALNYYLSDLNTSKIHGNLSNYYLENNEFENAFKSSQTSISVLVPFDTTDVKNLPSKADLNNSNQKIYLVSSLLDKANIWLKLAEENPETSIKFLKEAIKTLKLADFLVERARLNSKVYKSKLFWRKTATDIYIKAVKASYLCDNLDDAFYFIEKNKALLLLEDVLLKSSRNTSNIPDRISSRELLLRNKITELETAGIKSDRLRQEQLIQANETYNQFIESLDLNYQMYYKSKVPAEVLPLQKFRKKYVNDNHAYLEYIIDHEDGYGILLTNNGTQIFQIANADSLKNLAYKYRKLLETPLQDQNAINEYKTISYNIYKSLFPKEIESQIKDKRLTIVPDYYLQNIPFESLQTSNKDNSYLIYQNEISYAYSLSFLDENSKIERLNDTNLVGFAPIEFSSKLPDLPNTKEELDTIQQLLNSDIFLYDEASTTAFFNRSKASKIIHIASHANANDSINPWIAFHDSKVDLNDIYNLKNSAELVVLSACNTSLGELYKGEGVMSLSRGFFNTGAHSVMPTMWEVNDKASVALLGSFYSKIKDGQNKSLALHNAKLEYLKNNSLSQASPHYWASFVLIGDPGTIEINNGFSTLQYVLFAIIVLILIAIILIRKK